MHNKRIDKIITISAFFVIGVVVLFTIARQFFGAELSDEAYSVADTYMVSEGALPFVNNWSQMPGWPLVLAPFMKIFTLINGGTEGIFLYFRFLCLGINAITCIVLAILLKKHIRNRMLLALLTIIYFGASGFNALGGFRGDKLAIDLTAIGVMLLVVFFADDKREKKYAIWSGVLLALSVLSYPTYALLFFFYTIAVYVLCHRRKRGYKELLLFALGAAIPTIIVILYLAINSGITDIFEGLHYLLKDVTYFQLENEGITKLPGYIKGMGSLSLGLIKSFIKPFFFCVLLAILSFAIFAKQSIIRTDSENIYIAKPKIDCRTGELEIKRKYVRQILLLTIILGICLYHLDLIRSFGTADHTEITSRAITIETICVLLIWPFIRSERRICKYFMGLIWFPSYVWVVITGVGTYSSIMGRHQLLKNAAFLLGVMVYFAIKDNFIEQLGDYKGNNKFKGTVYKGFMLFSGLVPVVLMMVISFTYLFNAYSYVYRDESFWKLDTVVLSGPYKGLRTTSIRAEGLIELDETIDKYVNKDDYVLAMDNDPFIYLMVDGKACTPCSWDQALYSYHFDQPDLYYDYFKITNTEPTKIIYFNYGRDEIMSIDVEYKFNDYVRNNYELIYEDRNIFDWNYCGRDLTCELLIFDRK